MSRYIFGPVASRRLGRSLGVDIVSPKTCTQACIYCEVPIIGKPTTARKPYIPADLILTELETFLSSNDLLLDYITLSGAGEPTLNSEIGKVITGIKKLTDVPIALLTNGTLLHLRPVRDQLKQLDLIVPSLDTVIEDTFKRLNVPAVGVSLDNVINGIKLFAAECSAQIWLEILLVAGVNDTQSELEAFKQVIPTIPVHKVQISTVDRPPIDPKVKPSSYETLSIFAEALNAEIIAKPNLSKSENAKTIDDVLLHSLGIRPMTAEQIAEVIGLTTEETNTILSALIKSNILTTTSFDNRIYYKTN